MSKEKALFLMNSMKIVNLKSDERSGVDMRNIVSMVLVVFLTWCITFLYHLIFKISSITEFFVVFVAMGLLINSVYYVCSIMSIKRKMTRDFRNEIRLDADRRIKENPDCEAKRLLYGKRDNV